MQTGKYSNTDKAINILTRALIIMLPLFFLPIASSRIGQDNFNKGNLLLLLVPLLILLCGVSSFRLREFKIIKSWAYLPAGIFLLAVGLAGVFSVDVYSSFFGGAGMATYSYPSLVLAVLFCFFLINRLGRRGVMAGIIQSLLTGYVIAVFFTILALLAYWVGVVSSSGIIADALKKAFGSFEDLAMYISVMSVMAIGVYLDDEIRERVLTKRLWIICAWLAISFSFFLLILINFIYSWWALMLGGAVIFISKTVKHGGFKLRGLIWPLFFVLIPLVLILFNYQVIDKTLINRRLARSLTLDFGNSALVVKDSFSEHPLIGFGPNTFSYVFSSHRPTELNSSPYWYLRFNQAGSGIIDLASAAGLIGLLSFLALILFIGFNFSRAWLGKEEGTETGNNGGTGSERTIIFATLLSLIAAYFVYPANITLLFLFWVVFALFISISGKNKERLYATKTGSPSLAAALAIIVLASIWAIMLGLAGRDWAAAAYFNNGQADEHGLMKAAELNPRRSVYNTALAKFYKDKAIKALEKNERTEAASLVNKSIDYARTAIESAPISVAALETAGIIYRDISDYSPDSIGLAVEFFKRAIKIEPTNPVLWTELGKIQLKGGEADNAVESLSRAVSLKSDYDEAQFNLAKAKIDSGKENEALDILSVLEKKNTNADLYYEQGRAYYNSENFSEAVKKFQAALNLSPLHSNAMYSLALAYEAQGDKASALYYFKKVSEINPDNEKVKEKIKLLEE